MPLFQLGAGAQQHAAYIFFDNNLPGEDRLCIVCTIRKLDKEENEKAKQAIVERHGIGSLIRRHHTRDPSTALAEVQLEFFKYCIVFRGTSSCRIFDVERLCELEPTSQQQLLRGETTVKHKLALSHCEETAGVKKAEVRFTDLPIHDCVSIELTTYEDPQERCGITFGVSRGKATLENCYGGFVKAIHPRYLLRRKWLRLPPQVRNVSLINSSDYYVQQRVAVEQKNGEMKIMDLHLPRTQRAFPDL